MGLISVEEGDVFTCDYLKLEIIITAMNNWPFVEFEEINGNLPPKHNKYVTHCKMPFDTFVTHLKKFRKET